MAMICRGVSIARRRGSVIIPVQMDKTVASADEAIADLFDGATLMAGGFGLCGIPENLIAAHPAQGDQGPDHHLQQLRHRRQGPGHPARERAGEEDDLQLRGREQDVRAPVPRRQAGGGAQPAGHAGRAHPRGRRRHPRRSTRRPASAPWSPRARRRASSTGATTCSRRALHADFALVKAWKATASATSSTARRRATSTR